MKNISHIASCVKDLTRVSRGDTSRPVEVSHVYNFLFKCESVWYVLEQLLLNLVLNDGLKTRSCFQTIFWTNYIFVYARVFKEFSITTTFKRPWNFITKRRFIKVSNNILFPRNKIIWVPAFVNADQTEDIWSIENSAFLRRKKFAEISRLLLNIAIFFQGYFICVFFFFRAISPWIWRHLILNGLLLHFVLYNLVRHNL